MEAIEGGFENGAGVCPKNNDQVHKIDCNDAPPKEVAPSSKGSKYT